MNLFQKEISSFSSEIEKNEEEIESIKSQVARKNLESYNLDMEICDLDKQINCYKIMIERRAKVDQKIEKERLKRNNMSLVTFVGSMFSLTLFSINFLLPIVLIILLNLLNIKMINKSRKNVKDLFLKKNRICNNKSINEINNSIQDFIQMRKEKTINKKNVYKELDELLNKLEQAREQSSKIHENYKMVLDFYEEILKNIDMNLSMEERDRLVNLEHANVMPKMIKKIYNENNV